MVLVDTSVWIRFLSNREPYSQELDRLLDLDQVTGHDLVYGELLIGDRGGRHNLLASYGGIRRASTVPHLEVLEFVRSRKLYGRGVGWIDIHLLASSLVERLSLWTAGARLSAIATELGIGYERFRSGGTTSE